MPNLSLKQKIMILVALLGAVLILIFQRGLYGKGNPGTVDNTPPQPPVEENSEPKIVSTNPSPLDEGVILPNQTMEITFNRPLENIGEFKNRIEPKVDYKTELSLDRKTIRIIPQKPFPFGSGYTLFILPDTKFDGKRLDKEIIIHFRTIDYQGI